MTREPDPRRIDLEIEVPGTPEQVWEAIATGPGISAWLHPTEVEEREGGSFSFDMGAGPRHGTVTAWEPPHRFGQEVEWEPRAAGAPARLATEWLVQAREGGTCVVRMVMSGFGSGQGWDDEIDGMRAGMRQALEALRRHLELAGSGTAEAVAAVFAGLPVADLERALEWYERLLGRPADAHPMAGLAEWHLPQAGSIQLVLDPERAGGGLVTLQVADLQRYAALLGQRGLSGVEIDDTTSDKVLFATLLDPDGNGVTLVEQRGASTAPDAAVRAVLSEREAAVRSRDVARFAGLYANDAVVCALAPPLRATGISREGLEAWFASFGESLEREVRDLRVTADGDVAFAHALARIAGDRADGGRTSLWFRETLALRRDGGSWRITHEHASVPFLMDGSDRAALDLEP